MKKNNNFMLNLLTVSTFLLAMYVSNVNGYVKGCKTIVDANPEKYMKKDEREQ
jgi:SNF family Na+-dependent transporter